MILELENALVNQLALGLGALSMKVEAFPDRPENYIFSHPVGIGLVRFHESPYSRPDRTDLVIQNRDLQFQIVIMVRNLRKHDGLYAALEATRAVFQGYKAPKARGPVYMVSERFLDQRDGEWKYEVLINVPTVAVQLADVDDLPGSGLTTPTFTDSVELAPEPA